MDNTAKDYRWNAEDYARNASAQYSWASELIGKLALSGGERLLDVGCGDGRITAELAARLPGGKVLGIDASEQMITSAATSYPPASYPNLSFRHMDAQALVLDGGFDVAFSNAALHWVADHPAVLRGLRAVLRPGGRILLQMGGRGNAAGMFDAVNAVIAAHDWRGYFDGFQPPYHFYGPEDYGRWLPEACFEPLRVELIPKAMRHADTEGLRGWFRSTWFPYTDSLPERFRAGFIDEVIAVYLAAHPPAADGATEVAMVRLEVEARVLPVS